jgi:hypothetical protein
VFRKRELVTWWASRLPRVVLHIIGAAAIRCCVIAFECNVQATISSVMGNCRMFVGVFALAFLCVATDAWDDLCTAGGQCEEVERAYAVIIQGLACRSLYTTGQCSGLCTRSLKAMIGRHLWAKCADRCDWSPGLVAAADSWLALCLSRPAPGADEVEVLNIVSRRGQRIPEDDAMAQDASAALGRGGVGAHAAGAGLDSTGAQNVVDIKHKFVHSAVSGASLGASVGQQVVLGRSFKRRESIYLVGVEFRPWMGTALRVSFLAIALLLIYLSSSRGAPAFGLFRVAHLRMRGSARSSPSTGMLGPPSVSTIGSSSRDLASLRRGTRRHLKGMRGSAN